MDLSDRTKTVAKNTGYLYFRSIFVMLINIYTSRIILEYLGIDDYGIYNVVGGTIAMFSLFSETFVSATQRYLAFSFGENDQNKSREIFSIAVKIHVFLAIVLVLLIETIGLWYLNTYMNLPSGTLNSANWVFQICMIAFVVNLISIPYNALIITKERMSVFAYVSIFECLSKLGIAFSLSFIIHEKLIIYSILLLLISIIIRIFYGIYCKKNFEECKIIPIKNKKLFHEFLKFSGWNFLGSSSTLLYLNGINLVLNFFCGVTVNAARGISSQVQGAVTQLVNNFLTALKPQIIKSYAIKDYDFLTKILCSGSKFGFYLMLIISMPLIFTAKEILNVWLTDVPPYTSSFVIVILISLLLQPFTNILDNFLGASGNIKNCQLTTSIFNLLILPLSILVLYLKQPPYSVFIVCIIIGICNWIVRIYNCSKFVSGFNTKIYIENVVLKSFMVLPISLVLPTIYKFCFYKADFFSWVILCFLIEVCIIVSIYIIGLNVYEKASLSGYIKTRFKFKVF